MSATPSPTESDTLPARVILLAPRSGTSGVGDYADDFANAIRRHVDVVELRHGPPGADRLTDIRRLRRELRALLATSPAHTVVHAELSGGATPAFWAIWGLRSPVTATIHDAPRPIWFPLMCREVLKVPKLNGIVHRPFARLWVRVERRGLRNVDVVALTSDGVQRTRELMNPASVVESGLFRPPSSVIPPPWERPMAVGLFGHMYGGKGFDLLAKLRSKLPPSVLIRVAGRGTESLPAIPGVEICGPVEGDEVAKWFSSVRVVLLPYSRESQGIFAASATHMLAAAYQTPSVALASKALLQLESVGACRATAGVDELCSVAEQLVTNETEMRTTYSQLVAYIDSFDEQANIAPYLELWRSSAYNGYA